MRGRARVGCEVSNNKKNKDFIISEVTTNNCNDGDIQLLQLFVVKNTTQIYNTRQRVYHRCLAARVQKI